MTSNTVTSGYPGLSLPSQDSPYLTIVSNGRFKLGTFSLSGQKTVIQD